MEQPLKKWGIYFCYGGIKHLLFDIQATSVDFEKDFTNLTFVGSVKKGIFYADELLISKVITFYASSDRKNVNINTGLAKEIPFANMDQDIYANVWANEIC
jgi:hypothetical protein